jgi:hypothetical protein
MPTRRILLSALLALVTLVGAACGAGAPASRASRATEARFGAFVRVCSVSEESQRAPEGFAVVNAFGHA